ncbi:hypothetical protein Tco_1234264 [Tanacetum coccineum]
MRPTPSPWDGESVKENVRNDILQTLPFKVGKLPMKYLGIPLLAIRLKLIASVLSTMQAYWAAVVKIPKIIINDIDRVLKKFLWSNNELSKGRSKVSWKIFCKPKCEDEVKWKNSEGKLIDFNIKNAWWDLRDKKETVKWWKMKWFPQCNPRNRKLESRMNMSNVPSYWKDIIEKVAEQPCNNAIRSVVRRITLATAVYYIWKERKSRIFNDTKFPCENILQMIMENIMLQTQRLQVKKSKQVCKVAMEWNVKFAIKDDD